jgi:hypothetical protein
VLFLVPLSTLALLRALDGERRLWWGVYWLAATLALYSHYTSGLVIAVQGAWALYAERERWRSILAVNAAIAVAFLPWVPMLDNNAGWLQVIERLRPLTAENVVGDSLKVAFGHPHVEVAQVPGLVSLVLLGLAATIAAATFVIVGRRRSRGAGVNDRSRPARPSREIWLLALLVLVPPLLTLAYSIVETSIYLPRNAITLLPYLCVLAATAVAALPRRAMIAVATLAIAAALLGSVRMVLDSPRPDLRAAANHVEKQAAPGTPVIEPVIFPRPWLAQDLAVHLDDEYPLSHDLGDLGRQPRGKDFYVVLSNPTWAGPVDEAAKAAGAEINAVRQIDGFHDVFVRRYTR